LFKNAAELVAILNASLQQEAIETNQYHGKSVADKSVLVPAMMAFVEAMAGMIFLTTPCVSDQVTPSILNS
jgi:hypothetical protein